MRSGIARLVKQSADKQYTRISDAIMQYRVDPSMGWEQESLANQVNFHFQNAVSEIATTNNQNKAPIRDKKELLESIGIAFMHQLKHFGKIQEQHIQSAVDIMLKFASCADKQFPPLAAFLGGIVAQEFVKSVTKKWTPIN